MELFPSFFDTLLCFGILYHHRNPIQLLQGMHAALVPGGELIVETQAIPGDEEICLFPEDRYGRARNVYFIPTASCTASWMKKSGFKNVEIIDSCTTTNEEQRKTEWMPYMSLEDFLDPEDSSKTVEGYPAPIRIVVRGERGY